MTSTKFAEQRSESLNSHNNIVKTTQSENYRKSCWVLYNCAVFGLNNCLTLYLFKY